MSSSQGSYCMYSEWMSEEEFRVSEDNEDENIEKDQKNVKKKGYKHVPHRDKPAQVVAKRNARERRRVQAVNMAFARLRKMVPVENSRGKRISKVKTLQYAINYIHALVNLIDQDRNYNFLLSNNSQLPFNNKFQSHYSTYNIAEELFVNFEL